MNTLPSTLDATPGGRRCCAAVESLLGSGAVDVFALRAAAWQAADQLDEFVCWLTELRADRSQARAVAARSYWHPNGFAKLVLHSSTEPEYKIRLHVWPAVTEGPRLGESNPHSHRWDFASTVVAGNGLHMVEYEETDQRGRPYDRYRYGADPNDRAALLSEGGTRLRRTAIPHVRRGQIYSCDTAIVHTVAPIETDLTATLVIQGPQRTPSTVVYREPGLGDDQPNGMLTESDLLALTGDLIAAYAAQRDADA